MSTFLASFILLIAGFLMPLSVAYTQDIGHCNLTYFISFGQKCQRLMITNLQSNPNANCSKEYQYEKKCLRDHVDACFGRKHLHFVDQATALLLHQLYHCGDLKYKHDVLNGMILKAIKCQPEAFLDTEFCWHYFRERFDTNRTDPLLCREYAIAKKCITEKAKANCQICDHVRRDAYNPFCPNKTDPLLQVNACRDLLMHVSCNASRIYKMALDCEKTFVTSFMGNTKPNCRTAGLALKQCLNTKISVLCPDYARIQRLKDDVLMTVTSLLRGRRFFCSKVSVRAIDIDFKVRPLIPCSAEFMPEMEKCALPLREAYRLSENATNDQLCRNFQMAVNCSNTAQKSYCKFEKGVTSMIHSYYSSFCEHENGGDPEGIQKINGVESVSICALLYFPLFWLVSLTHAT